MTAQHPDPDGEQLATYLVPALRLFLKDRIWCPGAEAAVFLDWCSLPQEPRTAEEFAQFKCALKTINVWYAHQSTLVWMLTRAPATITEYNARGWPTFERALSSLIHDSAGVLDLGGIQATDFEQVDSEMTYSDLVYTCTLKRNAPQAPIEFANTLATKTFTNGADRGFVAQKYAETFLVVVGCAVKLEFTDLRWDDVEVRELANVVPFSNRLQELNLSTNNITDVADLCTSLAKAATLTYVDLSKN